MTDALSSGFFHTVDDETSHVLKFKSVGGIVVLEIPSSVLSDVKRVHPQPNETDRSGGLMR